jgi:hypothetical protein
MLDVVLTERLVVEITAPILVLAEGVAMIWIPRSASDFFCDARVDRL